MSYNWRALAYDSIAKQVFCDADDHARIVFTLFLCFAWAPAWVLLPCSGQALRGLGISGISQATS